MRHLLAQKCKIIKIFENMFLQVFLKFYVMADLFGRFLVQNWHVPYFLFHRFVFRDPFSVRIGRPLLCRTCFHMKLLKTFLESTAFTRITTCTKQELYFRIIATSPRYLLQRSVSIENITLCQCLFFFRSSPTRHAEE